MKSIFWENKNKGRNLKSDNLKIIPMNLNEIVLSWIPSQDNWLISAYTEKNLTFHGFVMLQWLLPPCLFKNIFSTNVFILNSFGLRGGGVGGQEE